MYSDRSGNFCLEIEEVLHYNDKPYIPETLQADFLKKNHDDPLAGHFRVEKRLDLLTYKYF